MIETLLHLLPPERAHAASVLALSMGLPLGPRHPPAMTSELFGKPVPNRVGLSGGADKNAQALAGWGRIGFGFVEAGTVTPLPRPGNPGTRVWRIGDDAMVNWMGLPNEGIEAFTANLAAFRATAGGLDACVGASVSSPSGDAGEMRAMGKSLSGLVDFLTLNASCPNTEHPKDALAGPVRELGGLREGAGRTPILVKLAPIADEAALDTMVDGFLEAGVDGFVACNTVPAALRGLVGPRAPAPWPERDGNAVGGLSGPALLPLSLRMVSRIRARAGANAVVIGVGGITKPDDLRAMLDAGADAVEVYTAVARGGRRVLDDLVATDVAEARLRGTRKS